MKNRTLLLGLFLEFASSFLFGQTNSNKLIRDWVENNKAPERVVMSKIENGKAVMTRPVYPFPKVTVYVGKGDTNLEKNFVDKKE